MQLWQFSIRTVDHTPEGSNSFLSRFKRMPRQAKKRRIWQTVVLSGPLALSGCASIVKTYVCVTQIDLKGVYMRRTWNGTDRHSTQLLKSLGERNDFTRKFLILPPILYTSPLT